MSKPEMKRQFHCWRPSLDCRPAAAAAAAAAVASVVAVIDRLGCEAMVAAESERPTVGQTTTTVSANGCFKMIAIALMGDCSKVS